MRVSDSSAGSDSRTTSSASAPDGARQEIIILVAAGTPETVLASDGEISSENFWKIIRIFGSLSLQNENAAG